MKLIRRTLFLFLMCALGAACLPLTQEYVPIPPFTTAVPSDLPTLASSLEPIATTAALNPTFIAATFTPIPSVTPYLPTATPTPPRPTGFTPILLQSKFGNRDFFLLGGVDEKSWFSTDQSATVLTTHISAGNALDFYARGKTLITSKGTMALASPTCKVAFIKVEAEIASEARIGVRPGWPVTFAAVTEIQTNTKIYQEAVSAWLTSQGLTAPEVKILQIWRVDMEGDKTNEVLISAARFKETSGHMTELGDYSVVLLRKVVGNRVVTIPLVRDIYTNKQAALTFPKTYRLIEVADLNGDNLAEIIVDAAYWEGLGAMVYAIDGNQATQVLKANCP